MMDFLGTAAVDSSKLLDVIVDVRIEEESEIVVKFIGRSDATAVSSTSSALRLQPKKEAWLSGGNRG
ncbi:hypothetical protein GCK72_013520 [Caenorhabditis remanei]|uniref:Uncharacterized protein n=1 Tax=Caenorhabditis remanei TaxID=31234 RepID=A0A6A5GRA4_CAERE|nr:hypothetical protein GCK72_013520 [Caenorhabditis remanei]KAF1757065.1 hypothetical protein GCK72_013520 [Caenorhabditis remanei]